VQKVLVDSGPLIALFDKSDSYHKKSLEFFKEFKGVLWTSWPVVTEVCHMLDFSTRVQINFLTWIERGGLRIQELKFEQLSRLIELTRKFNDVPMDLADASLIVISESLDCEKIASIDSDFYIYRNIRNKYLQNIFN
jgi:hypothetical protein